MSELWRGERLRGIAAACEDQGGVAYEQGVHCMEINTNPHDRSYGLRLAFSRDGYPELAGDEAMDRVDAEEAVCFGLLRENDSLSTEQAKLLAADFIRNGRSLHIVVSANRRQRHYYRGYPFLGCHW
jgi:hypothetical protein